MAVPPGALVRTEAESRPDPFGLREAGELVRASGRLIARHWLPLLALAVGALAANAVLAQLAVVAGRAGAVPGFLVLALVPLSGLVALVGMLLVLRSRQSGRSDVWGVVAAVGSVLIPYLVVYQSRGDLRADLIEYVNAGLIDDGYSAVEFQRLPQIGSWLVLGIVLAAVLVRSLGSRWLQRTHGDNPDDPRRGLLRVVVGYSEAVWVTLGVWVVTGVAAILGIWWASRSVSQQLFAFWAQVRIDLPSLGALGDWFTSAIPVITDAVVTGVVVPLSMLTIAVIVYGLQVADTLSADDVVRAASRGRAGALTRRVGEARLRQAWAAFTETSGRFGALTGGVLLVLRSAFAPVLAYCVLFTLIAQLDGVVWWLARTILGYRSELVWQAWYDPLNGIAQVVTLVLTVAVTAVFADRLLTRFGAAGQLKTGGRDVRQPDESSASPQDAGSSMNSAGGNAGESTRTETGSAPSGSSTSIA